VANSRTVITNSVLPAPWHFLKVKVWTRASSSLGLFCANFQSFKNSSGRDAGVPFTANDARRCAHLRPRVAASQRDALVRCATANVPSSGFPEDSANLIEMIAVMSGHMLCQSSHGDSASLGMIAVAFPLLGRKALE
jgi:hypothetical protein